MKLKGFKTFTIVALLAVCLLLAVWGYVLYEYTLVQWWLPVAAALFLGVVTSPLFSGLSRFVTDSSNKWTNTVCSLAIAGTLSYFALLGCNFWLADPDSAHKEKVEILEKHQEKKQKYRRVGRGRMVPTNDYYYEYSFTVRFEDGTVKTIPASAKAYARTRAGRMRTYTLRTGALGYKVIK